ncbi:MAG: DUF1549 domain-containing protein [Planctomycetes bacterium]|nr:DUF1549 domain-containing protein [Planctomycetota bacterium]
MPYVGKIITPLPARRMLLRSAVALWAIVVNVADRELSAADASPPPSFTLDVMPALSKAGCNLGTCHGNANGKGGFKLSLRGQDPDVDFLALTHDQLSRRVNLQEPDQSLLLLKATMRQAHEGGRRFKVDAPEYRVLRDWIAAGAKSDVGQVPQLKSLVVRPQVEFVHEPVDRVQLTAEAEFTDGRRRDVTTIACYETSNKLVEVDHDGLALRTDFGETTVLVRYLNLQQPVRLTFVRSRPDYRKPDVRPVNYVDEHILAKLDKLRIAPSELCDDVTFLRRAYLDLLGFVPSGPEAERFLKDERADKRDRLIDELLDRPEYADYWALKYADLLRVEEKTLDRKGVQNFHAWIRRWIEQDRPMNEFAAEVVSGRGDTYTSPAAAYYRAQRDPVVRAETTAQVFLGVRLQCAKCHNHPFDRWTQTDYYSWTNLFARVSYKVLENTQYDKNDKIQFEGRQVVFAPTKGDFKDPRTGEPRAPRMLGTASDLPEKADRLRGLADWLGDDANPFFAQSQVNRVWFHLMGRGIVDPIDDFRATNPASHPELLASLTKEFVTGDFRLKPLIRTIMRSRAYQTASTVNATNADDDVNYSHAIVRSLTAEQTLDSLMRVTGTTLKFEGYPAGMRAGQLPGVRPVRDKQPVEPANRFLTKFGKPQRLLACECERSSDFALGQVFELIGGPIMVEMLTKPGNRIDDGIEAGKSTASLLDALYWNALSRRPSKEERAAMVEHIESAKDRRAAWQDVAWALLNSKEFLLRR